jgi:membrane protein implicated in regulation of membrane protease activity
MEHFTFNPVTIWLTLGILAAVVEVLSPLFGFILITVAALLAALLAVFGLSVSVQLLVFALTLLFLLVIVRPRVVARLAPARGVPDRTDQLLGQRGRVVEALDPVMGTGRVMWVGHGPRSVEGIARRRIVVAGRTASSCRSKAVGPGRSAESQHLNQRPAELPAT